MSQIAYIALKKKLREKIKHARTYPFFSVSLSSDEFFMMLDLIDQQAKTIKGMDQKLSDLFDRLPDDDLKAEVAEEWLGMNALEGADDEA